MPPALQFLDDPGDFLAAAAELLASAPVESTVVAGVTDRMVREAAAGIQPGRNVPSWWLVVRDEAGVVVGAGMSTAPFAPYPPYLLPMPEEAARALARTLHGRGEVLGGVNGALPTVEVVAAETARLTGASYRVAERVRLHELGELVEPVAPPGRARPARAAEVDLLLSWHAAFGRDAAQQAGSDEPHAGPEEDHDSMLRRIAEGSVWVWEDESGQAVHFSGVSRPAYGVARIGPVYTPGDRRGRGYAGATVAAASRVLLDQGARVCLFTDQANPVSNALYERLGFRPVVDMANVLIE